MKKMSFEAGQGLKRKKSYTAEFKLKVVAFAKENGNRSAGRNFSVNEKSVREWQKDESELQKVPKHKRARRGQKCKWPILEKNLTMWILSLRENGHAVKTSMICAHAQVMAAQMGIANFKGGLGWCQKFMRRNKLTVQHRTTVGQHLPDDWEENVSSFRKVCQNAISDKKIPLKDVIHLDEVPMQFDLPISRTVNTVGARTVSIATTGHEETHFTLMAACTATGEKLQPVVIGGHVSDDDKKESIDRENLDDTVPTSNEYVLPHTWTNDGVVELHDISDSELLDQGVTVDSNESCEPHPWWYESVSRESDSENLDQGNISNNVTISNDITALDPRTNEECRKKDLVTERNKGSKNKMAIVGKQVPKPKTRSSPRLNESGPKAKTAERKSPASEPEESCLETEEALATLINAIRHALKWWLQEIKAFGKVSCNNRNCGQVFCNEVEMLFHWVHCSMEIYYSSKSRKSQNVSAFTGHKTTRENTVQRNSLAVNSVNSSNVSTRISSTSCTTAGVTIHQANSPNSSVLNGNQPRESIVQMYSPVCSNANNLHMAGSEKVPTILVYEVINNSIAGNADTTSIHDNITPNLPTNNEIPSKSDVNSLLRKRKVFTSRNDQPYSACANTKAPRRMKSQRNPFPRKTSTKKPRLCGGKESSTKGESSSVPRVMHSYLQDTKSINNSSETERRIIGNLPLENRTSVCGVTPSELKILGENSVSENESSMVEVKQESPDDLHFDVASDTALGQPQELNTVIKIVPDGLHSEDCVSEASISSSEEVNNLQLNSVIKTEPEEYLDHHCDGEGEPSHEFTNENSNLELKSVIDIELNPMQIKTEPDEW